MSNKLILKGLPKGYYTEDSTIYVNEDQLQTALDIQPEKIVKGQVIAGVSGLAIENGTDTTDATATANDIVEDKTAYVDGNRIIGNIVNQSAETAGLGWDFLTETIQAGQSPTYGRAMFVAIPKGAYLGEFTNKSWEGPAGPVIRIPSQIRTVTPSEYSQTISTTSSVIEKVTINAIPARYKDTSGTTAVASDILAGKTAVTTNGKITGTLEIKEELIQEDLYPTLVRWTSNYSDEEEEDVFVDEEVDMEVAPGEETEESGVVEGEVDYVETSEGETDEGIADLWLAASGMSAGRIDELTTVYISADDISTAMDIKPEQIMYGNVICNVKGTGTEDATADARYILTGNTAYVKGQKLYGEMSNRNVIDPDIGGFSSTLPEKPVQQGKFLQYVRTTNNLLMAVVSPPTGYYHGDGNTYVGYKAFDVTCTPTTSTQTFNSGESNGSIRTVTVNPIPSNYEKTLNCTISLGSFNLGVDEIIEINMQDALNRTISWNVDTSFIISFYMPDGDMNLKLFFSENSPSNMFTYQGHTYDFLLDYAEDILYGNMYNTTGGSTGTCEVTITKIINLL